MVRLAHIALGAALVFTASVEARAHNPHAMSVRLHDAETEDFIEVIAPTAGAQSALDAHFGDVVPLDSKAGKERFVAYLKRTLDLRGPEGRVELGEGAIRVTPHQVVVRLRVSAPSYPLAVHAPVLEDNPGQIVTFRVVGEREARVVLDARTGFAATVTPSATALPETASVHGHAH